MSNLLQLILFAIAPYVFLSAIPFSSPSSSDNTVIEETVDSFDASSEAMQPDEPSEHLQT